MPVVCLNDLAAFYDSDSVANFLYSMATIVPCDIPETQLLFEVWHCVCGQ